MTDLLERPVLYPSPLGPVVRTCVICLAPSGDLPECAACAMAEEDLWKRRLICT